MFGFNDLTFIVVVNQSLELRLLWEQHNQLSQHPSEQAKRLVMFHEDLGKCKDHVIRYMFTA